MLFIFFPLSLLPFLPTHTHITSHNCAVFNTWETFLRGEK